MARRRSQLVQDSSERCADDAIRDQRKMVDSATVGIETERRTPARGSIALSFAVVARDLLIRPRKVVA